MRVERGASQILFGLLPGQTADLDGRIWRVTRWVDPIATALDQDSVRQALISALVPWTQQGTDDGLTAELRGRSTVEVVALNMDRGVLVEPFPQQWRCKTCGRISSFAVRQVSVRRLLQSTDAVRHVSHVRRVTHAHAAARMPTALQRSRRATPRHRDGTGPAVPVPCLQHHVEPGIPVPAMRLRQRRDEPDRPSRSRRVLPRFAVLVNPPDPAVAARLRAGGGGARALEWVLGGMESDDPTAGRQTLAGLIDTLRLSGVPDETSRRPGPSGGGERRGRRRRRRPRHRPARRGPREGVRRGPQPRLRRHRRPDPGFRHGRRDHAAAPDPLRGRVRGGDERRPP